MATNAFDSAGTEFQRGDGGSPEVFTKLAEVKSISGPSPTRETQDATSLDSTGGYREFIGSFRDGGELTIGMNFVPTDPGQSPTTGIINKFNGNTVDNYRIVFSDASSTTSAFSALVTGYSTPVSVGELVQMEVTLKISGAVTWS